MTYRALMYSFPNFLLVCCSMSSSNFWFFTCIQVSKVRWSGIHISLRIFHTLKDFSIVNEAEVDAFLEFLCFLFDPVDVDNFISGSSALSKFSLYTWKFSVDVLLKPSLKNFEVYLASVWTACNCMVVWTFFGFALLWDWNENWPFPVLWPMNFPNLLAYWVQRFNSIIF